MLLPGRVAVALALAVPVALAGCSSPSPAGPRATPPTTAGASGTPASATATSTAADAADWPMYHGTPDHAGVSTTMPAVTSRPVLAQSLKLDGAVYASPIVVHGLTVVATENDTVYAFDQAYRQVWSRHLGEPSPSEQRQCGDIDPLGITGTPIYRDGSVYLVAETGGTLRHRLFALDLASGATRWTRDVDLPGVSARDMQQRGALAISGGRVWVSYGAQAGDCGRYKGRVVGVPLSGTGSLVAYTPPTERGGGIWNPAGPTVDQAGDLYVVSANGAAFPGHAYDHTNSVLRLDGNAALLDAFAPSDWAQNNQADVGLGSQGVALVGTRWAVLGGKSGPVYVLDRGHLGGIGGQVSVQDICRSFGGAAVAGDTVYLPCTDGVRAVRVDGAGRLHVRWHASAGTNGSPVVGGGRVWVLDYDAGVLHALDPASGHSTGEVRVGAANRFATPALHGSTVIVPTLSGIAVVSTRPD